MIDHAIKDGIINFQWVIQIPRSRIESFNNNLIGWLVVLGLTAL